mmetsp:Transcript_20469/g.23194  ORF Transcript_20469/g.23194 Transcript_20469/m.23194 type:complete len:341 (-) Transcript_20469:176-1198(-)
MVSSHHSREINRQTAADAHLKSPLRAALWELRMMIFICFLIIGLYFFYTFFHIVPLLENSKEGLTLLFWQVDGDLSGDYLRGIIYFIIFNVLIILLLWSMAKAITIDAGRVLFRNERPGLQIPDLEAGRQDEVRTEIAPRGGTGSLPSNPTPRRAVSLVLGENHTPVTTFNDRSRFGRRRRCPHCKILKPDRAHHCRKCSRCTLRMDHHCHILDVCIGYYNHKYFLNMLFYASVTSLFIVFTQFDRIVYLFHEKQSDQAIKIIHAVLFCFTLLLACLITGFFCAHLVLLGLGQTTIECCEKYSRNRPSPHTQSNMWLNFTNICTKNPLVWILPISPHDTD